MAELIANRIRTTLNGAINNSVTSLTATDASDFPATGDFRIRIDDEILKVTAVAGNVFTVDRAAEPIDGAQVAASHTNLSVIRLVLTAGGLNARFATVGGGGASIDSDIYANLPAAGTAGHLYLPTDAPVVLRDDGSAWQSFGPVFPLKFASPPTTWLNQNTATITTHTWGHYLFGPNNGSTGTISIRGREMAYPGTPFTLDVMVVVTGLLRDFMGYMPIIMRDSATGRIVSFGNARGHLEINHWTNTTTFSTSVLAIETSFPSYPMFYRVVDDGTNHTFYLSSDGQHWVQFLQQSRTLWLASPDKIGFAVNNQTGFFSVGMTVLHWYVH